MPSGRDPSTWARNRRPRGHWPSPCARLKAIAHRPSRPRGRRSGVDVDHGLLQQARYEAGLSLAQVAGLELTRQAVHLIENGRVRPSRRSLEIIAGRLGRPVSDFLRAAQPAEGGPDLAELELLCQRHQYLELLDLAEAIGQRRAEGPELAAVHLYAGQALHHLNRQDEALERLRLAERVARSIENPWLAAEAMEWQAVALHRKGDLRALELAREALSQYRELEPRRPEIEARMIERVGTFLTARREFDGARAHYREALEVLAVQGAVRDLESMGRVYHGLAGCARSSGDLRHATELMQQAVALYSVEHELRPAPARLTLPRAENDLGLLLLELGQLERAEDLLLTAEARCTAAGGEHLRAFVLLSLGELRQAQGRIEEAFAVVREAVELSARLEQVVTLAVGHEQLGELYAESGDDAEFRANFERALELLDRARLVERWAQCRAAFERLARRRIGAEAPSPASGA